MKNTHTTSPLPLLTFSHIKEGAAFIHSSHKIALPLHSAAAQVNTTTHHSLAAIRNIAFFKEPHYWVLITGIGKTPTLIALTHILTQWRTAISEVINIGCAGALTRNLHAPRPDHSSLPLKYVNSENSAHRQAQPLTLGRVLSVGTFLGVETIETLASGAAKQTDPKLTVYKKALLSSDPHAHGTLVTSPTPIGMSMDMPMGIDTTGTKETATRHHSSRLKQTISKQKFHNQIPSADIVDMEGYWNAVLAEQFGKPCSALKIISDAYDETFSLATFTSRLPKLSQILYDRTIPLLKARGLIKKPGRALPNKKSSPLIQQTSQQKIGTHPDHELDWESKIKTYMTDVKNRFHFTQNELQLLHVHLKRLALKLQNNPPAKHLESRLWEETLTALETESLQKKTTPQQKKQYLKLLDQQLPTRHWDKVVNDLETTTQHAKEYGIITHHQPSLEHVTLEIKLKSYTDWERAATFIESEKFKDVFTILAGDLSKWYPTNEPSASDVHVK